MVERIQAVRGMNDVLPDKTASWQYLEKVIARCLKQYGYSEIRFPIVESTQLFKRSIGEVTDIVEKEMYTFTDLNGDSLTLRPEGTAGCVRACLEHGLLHNQQQRLWYMGPMFRHEKPQKGRYRQFMQTGVEAFGFPGAGIEVELIALTLRFWKQLHIDHAVRLEINSLGVLSERQAYKDILVDYLKENFDRLDADSKRRLHTNPLRILDSKNPEMKDIISAAPKLIDTLGEESRQHFLDLCEGLDAVGIQYHINPFLVRGLDYYGHTVFEWVTDQLGSQSTVCAGGRYDSLVEQLGGSPCPAVGFAMGMERLLLLMEKLAIKTKEKENPSVYIISEGKEGLIQALKLAESIRDAEYHVITHTAGGSFKNQFKKADKSGARLALILGSDEITQQKVSIKDLRKEAEQITVSQSDVNQYLNSCLG